MIKLTDYALGTPFYVHVDDLRIVFVKEDMTTIKLPEGHLAVKESMEDVVKMVNIYRKTYMSPSINQHQGRDFR
jgi:uncharacterized protein YlzI (FlbEa/FlbD family)